MGDISNLTSAINTPLLLGDELYFLIAAITSSNAVVVVRIEGHVSKGHIGIDVIVAVNGYALYVAVEVLESREHGVGELVEDAS